MSESQERMMAVVEPGRRGVPWRSAQKWDVAAVVVGRSPTPAGSRSTGTASASSTYRRGRWPTTARPYERPFARPDWQDDLQADAAEFPAPTGDRRRPARPC